MYVSDLLNAFSCPLNHDVEDFLRNPNKALAYEKSDIGRTYLLYDRQAVEETGRMLILGYFTLAIKNFVFGKELSGTRKKKLVGMLSSEIEEIPGYLIGQIAKNFQTDVPMKETTNLHELLEYALAMIGDAQSRVGGRFVFLDCKKENEKVHRLYIENGFKDYQNITAHDGTEYIQMVQLIH